MSITSQIQLRVSLSSRTGDMLARKASELGVPVTQFVKFLIFKAVEQGQTFHSLSARSEQKIKQALEQNCISGFNRRHRLLFENVMKYRFSPEVSSKLREIKRKDNRLFLRIQKQLHLFSIDQKHPLSP